MYPDTDFGATLSDDCSRRDFLSYGASVPLLAGLSVSRTPGSGMADVRQTWSEANGITTTPVPYRDLLFGITSDGLLMATNVESEVNTWELSLGGFPYDDGLAVIGDTLLAGSSTGRLVAVEPASGDVQWQRTLSHPVMGFARDGTNVVVSSTGGLHSIALDDGRILWEAELALYRYGLSFDYVFGAVPTVVGDGVFVRTESGVTALSTSDGQLIWEQSVPKNTRDLIHGANLAVASETIFAVSDVLRAIDIRTGDVRWTVEGEAAGRSLYNRGFVSPVTDGSSVYTGIGTVQSFNADSGATNWIGGGFPAFLNPLTYDPETTTLYVSTVAENEMKVVRMNPDAGTELWQVVVGETRSGYALSRSEISRPIPHDGSVYVACRGTSISISERELDLTDSDSSTPTVTEDTGPDDSENQEREPQTTNTGQTTDPSTGEYRGLISNNPNTDIGNQLGDMYVLTLLSTALSIFVMLGQAFRRRGE